MRWDALFEDLQGQLAAAAAQDLEAEVNERARIESSGIELMDRLRAAAGAHVQLGLTSGSGRAAERIDGELRRCGDDWLLLRCGVRSVLVPTAAVLYCSGLGPGAVKSGLVAFSFSSALRAIARDRVAVALALRNHGQGTELHGVIDSVGKDFLELAVVAAGELRRPSAVLDRRTVPFTAVRSISSLASDER